MRACVRDRGNSEFLEYVNFPEQSRWTVGRGFPSVSLFLIRTEFRGACSKRSIRNLRTFLGGTGLERRSVRFGKLNVEVVVFDIWKFR